MTCPARTPKAPRYTCWERIPQITDRREILLCQQCPYGRQLMATVAKAPEFDPQALAGAVQEHITPKKENVMEAKTYTVPQLAAELGFAPAYIYTAKASKREPMPGSKNHMVLEAMRERGITWDNVVPAPRGLKKAHVEAAPSINSAPNVTPEVIAPPRAVLVRESSAPAIHGEADIADDTDCGTDAPNDQADSDCCDCEAQPVPLELVLAELKRRLPGASITITIA